ncbi:MULTISPECIES: hypothetical protein [unclassified Streptomyces]|uniref:hypothetical protein n=1 Tax=unclassified Streptomyces TaxID=2593676 RepID=UPI000DAE4615|nr:MULTISPECIES: hypothetical protein [unclassified Streptomyces]PZT75991.1 hypothetical protein DNK56_21650 [Streptomyces sp. AC1-42W]PZT80059.1 hypothetical protein DNK55_11035 [Streptomyces sp. AC1-42T]
MTDTDAWTPRRPLLSGALAALGCGLLLTGAGVMAVFAHGVPGYVQILYLVPVLGGMFGVLRLGIPEVRYALPMLVLAVLLIATVPAGFRSAILDLRGEHVQVTVTEVVHEGGRSYASSNQYHRCKVEAVDGPLWVKSDDSKCGAATRPGDRFQILRDPGNLVSASTDDSTPVSFTLLVPAVAGALLLLTILGARSLNHTTTNQHQKA